MRSSETKNNHFVPQFYLKNFRNEDSEIFSYDKHQKKYKKTKNLRKIGVQRDLYTITEKISKQEEKDFLKYTDINEKFLSKLVKFLNDDFKSNPSEISYRQEDLFTLYEHNFIETYHKILERGELPFFKEIKIPASEFMFQKLEQFIDNKTSENKTSTIKNKYYDFLYYIINQCFRVEKIFNIHKKDKHFKKIYENENINIKNYVTLFIHSCLPYLLDEMIERNLKLILLKNKTQTPFITSDKPVVNTFTYKYPKNQQAKDIEFYFPLSSDYAILYTKEDKYKSIINEKSEILITKNSKITHFNHIILDTSSQFIYGNSEEELRKIVNSNNSTTPVTIEKQIISKNLQR